MYSYAAGAPTGIVFMQSADSSMYTYAHPYPPGAYMTQTGAFTAYAPAAPHIMSMGPPQQAPSAASALIDVAPPVVFNPTPLKANVNPDYRMYTNRPFTNRSNTTNPNMCDPGMIRRTRSGHVSKTRVSKRAEATNLTKTCPSCSKQWRLCHCSNVKNRPAPKPYCKFVPPRMANKQRESS